MQSHFFSSRLWATAAVACEAGARIELTTEKKERCGICCHGTQNIFKDPNEELPHV